MIFLIISAALLCQQIAASSSSWDVSSSQKESEVPDNFNISSQPISLLEDEGKTQMLYLVPMKIRKLPVPLPMSSSLTELPIREEIIVGHPTKSKGFHSPSRMRMPNYHSKFNNRREFHISNRWRGRTIPHRRFVGPHGISHNVEPSVWSSKFLPFIKMNPLTNERTRLGSIAKKKRLEENDSNQLTRELFSVRPEIKRFQDSLSNFPSGKKAWDTSENVSSHQTHIKGNLNEKLLGHETDFVPVAFRYFGACPSDINNQELQYDHPCGFSQSPFLFPVIRDSYSAGPDVLSVADPQFILRNYNKTNPMKKEDDSIPYNFLPL